ncbi:hypothetical protein CLOM_g21390 [Closterium sp. NIES-68]|nr:hypothetical protein CLOM_g21390 [Closterium sp. NIES-68]GJP84332.1 hypothetical protein CLOP_g14399 [Closterium sp. NIES-67]
MLFSSIDVADASLANHFTQAELRKLKSQFDGASPSPGTPLTPASIRANSVRLGFSTPLSEPDADRVIAEFGSKEKGKDTEKGVLTFEGYLRLQADIDKGTSYFSPLSKPRNSAAKEFMRSPVTSTVHVINESEKRAYIEHINANMAEDEHVASLLPIAPEGGDLLDKVQSGVLLCKLVNLAAPGTIDVRAINSKAQLNAWQRSENHTLALNSARALGCQVVNISGQDIAERREHLLLGLIAQIIKVHLLSFISVSAAPELVDELEKESGEDVRHESSEQLLLRWMNLHLKKAGYSKEVANFSHDIKDGEAYTLLLNQLAPDACDLSPLQYAAGLERAQQVLKQADRIGCCKYVQAQDIVDGSTNLNLAFVANLFHMRHTLKAQEESKEEDTPGVVIGAGRSPVVQQAELEVDRSLDSDEERVYRFWINSVGVSKPVNDLFSDVRDGIVLLEVMDKIRPGCVEWKTVARPTGAQQHLRAVYKKIENCEQVLRVGRKLKLNIVGTGGNDIVSGNKKLILGFLWQLMHLHMVSLLQHLRHSHELSDTDILQWANERVEKAKRSSRMQGFKDSSLSSGLFFLDLMFAVEPRVVNWEIVTRGATEDDKLQNAHYVISVARKLGCSVFLVPNDIVKVRPKMILMLTASIMAFYLQFKEEKDQALRDSLDSGTTIPSFAASSSLTSSDAAMPVARLEFEEFTDTPGKGRSVSPLPAGSAGQSGVSVAENGSSGSVMSIKQRKAELFARSVSPMPMKPLSPAVTR